jgi:uncharacterized protein YggE
MKRTGLILGLMTLGAMALAACSPTTIVANPAPQQRVLNVTGTGTVTLTPDVAYINIGVHTESATASEAVAGNNAQTQKVIAALTQSAVDPKDIRTTNFSIYPNTQYDPQTNQKLGTTYVVDNTVYVTVHQIGKLGDLLDATVKAGANSINSIQFDVADKTAAIKQARDAAVKDARAQASELAGASGVSLGDLQSVNFYDNVPTPTSMVYGKGGGGGADAASVPIQSGQLLLNVTVSMTYEIK